MDCAFFKANFKFPELFPFPVDLQLNDYWLFSISLFKVVTKTSYSFAKSSDFSICTNIWMKHSILILAYGDLQF